MNRIMTINIDGKKIWAEGSVYGKLSVLIGLLILAPAALLPWYPQEAYFAPAFLLPGGACVLVGVLASLLSRGREEVLPDEANRQGRYGLIVLFAWGLGIVAGAVPFVLGGQLRVIPALFEAVSGWTTTGLSTMDVSKVPKIFLFHRSLMQYCGGLGFILMMLLFISGRQSAGLYSAEGHPDKIMPNIKRTARAIFAVYMVSLLLGTAAYRIAGMPWFDGLCHSMCSLSTGGFSTRLMSIGEYNSLPVEIITVVLMLIGTTNFAALLVLARGGIREFFRISEVRFMLLLFALLIPPVALSLVRSMPIGLLESLRQSAFNVASALSTTGYSTANYADWPPFAVGMLIVVMLIGGGIGSTAGGLKLSRVYLLLRLCLQHVRGMLSPEQTVRSARYTKASGKTPIDRELADETRGFASAYFLIFLIGSLALTVTADCSLTEAMFDFASALGTVGLSIGITGPATGNATLLVEMVGMILGRLEIFIVIIGVAFGVGRIRAFMAGVGRCRSRHIPRSCRFGNERPSC